mmetsp:Transcript_13445/g.21957  ORF Transcript_13445/g.21957 Transcript_13445/m.21957 type:complete len:169 (+) Transcript_13445:205-711(+)
MHSRGAVGIGALVCLLVVGYFGLFSGGTDVVVTTDGLGADVIRMENQQSTVKGSRGPTGTDDAGEGVGCVEFQVFGKVQNVFMRKYTKKAANRIGVTGYVENTADSTVRGVCCGNEDQIERFKTWLRTKGSPKSRIDRAEFKNIDQRVKYSKFSIKKTILPNGSQWAG